VHYDTFCAYRAVKKYIYKKALDGKALHMKLILKVVKNEEVLSWN